QLFLGEINSCTMTIAVQQHLGVVWEEEYDDYKLLGLLTFLANGIVQLRSYLKIGGDEENFYHPFLFKFEDDNLQVIINNYKSFENNYTSYDDTDSTDPLKAYYKTRMQQLSAAIDTYRAQHKEQRLLQLIMIHFGCGAGEISVTFSPNPKDGMVFIIPS